MAKWIVEGARACGSAHDGPESVSEPFMTSEGAKSFARFLHDKGYAVVVRVASEDGFEEISGASIVSWMNSDSDGVRS
jgi:hypothetical protein